MPNSLKPAFLIYWSIYPAIEELSYEEKGKLFDSIFLYTMGKEIVEMTGATKMAFNFIKQSLDLDTLKYESIVERNRLNGLKGGRPRNPENPVGYLVTQKTQRNPEEPKKANKNMNKNINKKEYIYTVKTENGTKDVGEEKMEQALESVKNHFNKVCDKKTTSTLSWKDGFIFWIKEYTLQQIITAITEIPKMIEMEENSGKPSGFWANMNLVTLFRKRNANGNADYIDLLLNNKKLKKLHKNIET
jgi:hypothetical protein